MTSTIIPAEPTGAVNIPDFTEMLPDYQERRLRAMWPDIPAAYQAQLLAAAQRLPSHDPELIAVAHEAERQGQIVRNQPAIQLMESWLAEDDPAVIQEQQETLKALVKAMPDDFPPYDELFP
ncbi:MAG: hypothetical protein M3Z04_16345 [Chloroflexota bacterium]|nr:hypothetical protein [Chloroflexota bacterium]